MRESSHVNFIFLIILSSSYFSLKRLIEYGYKALELEVFHEFELQIHYFVEIPITEWEKY